METTKKSKSKIKKSISAIKLPYKSPDFKTSNNIPEHNFYYSKKFENLHEINKKRTGYLFLTKEKERQMLRKKFNSFSNLIDNYYFPKYHKRSWWPNGQYKKKRRYN